MIAFLPLGLTQGEREPRPYEVRRELRPKKSRDLFSRTSTTFSIARFFRNKGDPGGPRRLGYRVLPTFRSPVGEKVNDCDCETGSGTILELPREVFRKQRSLAVAESCSLPRRKAYISQRIDGE